MAGGLTLAELTLTVEAVYDWRVPPVPRLSAARTPRRKPRGDGTPGRVTLAPPG
jgi:hypothetical protein